MPNEVTIYNSKEKNENKGLTNYRKVVAYIDDQNKLIIHCIDINGAANLMFGDSGVEFYLTIDVKNKNELILKLGITNEENLDRNLLDVMYKKFGEKDSCFEDIMDYFNTQMINFKYDKW